MSTISSRFYVTSLEDGTTLHGNLVSDKALTQAWNKESQVAVPNWTTVAEQPTIYLTLMSGNALVQPTGTIQWLYNNVEIQFSGNGNISSRVEYYLASQNQYEAALDDEGWSTTLPTLTTTNKYLWNYELVTYANGEVVRTKPSLLFTYEGTQVTSVTEYYLASPLKDNVTTATTGWGTSIPTIDTTNLYLWNYEKINLANSTSVDSIPNIIAIYHHSVDTNFGGIFQRTVYPVTMGTVTKQMPALKIIGNLASNENVDIDTITFVGSYEDGGASIGFAAETQIRISSISKGSNVGVINFVGGISDITASGQTITMYGILYGGENGGVVDGFTTLWYLNDAQVGTPGTTVLNNTYTNAYQVTEAQVVDHATIRCEFYVGTDLKYTAYADVDDMQDPEYMYVQYNGANGNAASLRRSDGNVTFQIWVGTRDNAGVLGGSSTPKFPVIKVQLLDGNGNIITATGLSTNIPDPDAGDTTHYYRTLPMSGGKGTISPHYDTVNTYGKNLTGIIIAYSNT